MSVKREWSMLLRYAFKLLFVAAILGAGYLLYRTWSQYSFDDVMRALKSIPKTNLVLGLLFAACSYFCLTWNDWLGVRYAGKPLPFRQTALASFTGLSIGHNVGLAALSSGAVRYRFYSRWGLSAEEIAKIIVFCGATVALGLSTLGAISLYLRPDDAAKMTGLSPSAVSGVAIACLAFPIIYLVLSATLRKPLRIRRWHFDMPIFRLAVGQVTVGTVNFAFVAACLHQMLSALGDAPYLKVATASITANIAAIISHIPGGLGVLEATVVHVMPGAESIAAVVAYRVIYYFIPLAIGIPLFIASEVILKSEEAPDPSH
jgi:glycosyltransferase 2 family protein